MKQTIVIEGPTFYAQSDEDAFFAWLKGIKSVERIVGSERNLEITLATEKLPFFDFNELAALFERYRLNKSCLRGVLRTDAKWAQNKNLYWYDDVIGSGSRPHSAKRRRAKR